MSRVNRATLERLQTLSAVDVVLCLADFAKEDLTFRPVHSHSTRRWYVTAAGVEYELLLTGPKFWDTRAQVGGGGAIDLAMHLARTDFRGAVRELVRRGL